MPDPSSSRFSLIGSGAGNSSTWPKVPQVSGANAAAWHAGASAAMAAAAGSSVPRPGQLDPRSPGRRAPQATGFSIYISNV